MIRVANSNSNLLFLLSLCTNLVASTILKPLLLSISNLYLGFNVKFPNGCTITGDLPVKISWSCL